MSQHRTSARAAEACEREADSVEASLVARLVGADAALAANPDSRVAMAVLEKTAPLHLGGIEEVLAAWCWLVRAVALRRLGDAEADREALESARRFLADAEPSRSPLLRRVRGWLGP